MSKNKVLINNKNIKKIIIIYLIKNVVFISVSFQYLIFSLFFVHFQQVFITSTRENFDMQTFTINQLRGRPAIKLLQELAKGKGIFFVDDTPILWEQRKFMGTVLKKQVNFSYIVCLQIKKKSFLMFQKVQKKIISYYVQQYHYKEKKFTENNSTTIM